MTRRVQATQIRAWAQQSGGPLFVAEIEDGGGNTIEAWATLDGGSGYLHLELKEAVTGRLLDDIEITPAAGMKLDRAWIWLRGSVCWVRFMNHQPGEGQPEGLSVDRYPWASPFIVPIPVQRSPMGREGATPLDGGTTVDPEQLKAALREVLGIPAGHNYDLAAGLVNVVGNIKPKVRAALDEAFDGGNGSAIVYQQLRNTSYSGALDALHHGAADVAAEVKE